MRRRRIFLCLPFLLVALPAGADVVRFSYSGGTGFFVSRDGYLLTSNHVVRDCKDISVLGAVPLTHATLVARDNEYDLALLKADTPPPDIASLNSEKQPLHVDDRVVVVGYPGQSWKTMVTETREAKIVNTRGPSGEEKWLEFSDALAQGNSGGPLLDDSGNVVGVVAAKGKLYSHEEDRPDELVGQFDLAISLPVIRQFLNDNHIPYQEADSGIYLSPGHITDDARRFVVNVRCRLDDGVRQ